MANYRKAIDKGLLKILSKMGISLLTSYHGAQIFEALGIADNVIMSAFKGTLGTINTFPCLPLLSLPRVVIISTWSPSLPISPFFLLLSRPCNFFVFLHRHPLPCVRNDFRRFGGRKHRLCSSGMYLYIYCCLLVFVCIFFSLCVSLLPSLPSCIPPFLAHCSSPPSLIFLFPTRHSFSFFIVRGGFRHSATNNLMVWPVRSKPLVTKKRKA